jgi:3-hydroxyisobutyrate dehydrogenase
MQRIALIGLGLMGSGMARNILKAGYELAVNNRTIDKARPLESEGARVATTPREAARDADMVISIVADDSASRAVWLGDDGALAGAKLGAILVESSTLTSAWVRELAQHAADRGCAFLDAPVRGGNKDAAAGNLNFLVGGDESTLDRARPVLEAMSRRIDHLGPVGSGATMKLISNMQVAVQVAALAEGLVLAERAGLDMDQAVTLLINGSPGSPIVKGKAALIAARDYQTAFALRWMHKDLSYALEEGVSHDAPLPTAAAAREIYRLAIAQGRGDDDFAAIAEVLRGTAG